MGTAGVRLSAADRRELQRVSQSDGASPRTRRRAVVVLLSDAGQSAESIAQVVGASLRTVRATRARWRRAGIESLGDAPKPGRPPRADAAYVRELVRSVQKDPRGLGFAFARWTAPRLVEHLRAKTGVTVTPAWLTELLRTHGFVWRRTKLTTRNLQDPAAVARAAKRLRRLKRGLSTRTPTTSSGSATA